MRLCLLISSIAVCRIIALIVDIFLRIFIKPPSQSKYLFKRLLEKNPDRKKKKKKKRLFLIFHDKHTQDQCFKKRLKILEN